jgi:hypothetical protein
MKKIIFHVLLGLSALVWNGCQNNVLLDPMNPPPSYIVNDNFSDGNWTANPAWEIQTAASFYSGYTNYASWGANLGRLNIDYYTTPGVNRWGIIGIKLNNNGTNIVLSTNTPRVWKFDIVFPSTNIDVHAYLLFQGNTGTKVTNATELNLDIHNASKTVSLIYRRNAAYSTIGSFSFSCVPNTWYTFRVERNSDWVWCVYLDDAIKINTYKSLQGIRFNSFVFYSLTTGIMNNLALDNLTIR